MNIGTFTVTDTNGITVFSADMNNFAINGDMIYIQCEGSFMKKLPLEKNELYLLSISNIKEMEGYIFTVLFNDYVFNAGSSSYVDTEGILHEGVVVLSNQLQFKKIGK